MLPINKNVKVDKKTIAADNYNKHYQQNNR